jgi:ubiquinone/menaquinone biosynthesis C-methylase UbiE
MLYRVLNFPCVYRLIRWIFNSDRVRPILLSGIKYQPGMRVLDIGCGTGELSECFQPEDYVGIDVSEIYIRAAQDQYKGTFHAMDALGIDQLGISFDRAFMNGVFHHLPDEKVEATLSALARVLKPEGFFFVMEAVWPSRRWDLPGYFFRWLDRGKYVRTASKWRKLLGATWHIENLWLIHNSIVEDIIVVLCPPTKGSLQRIAQDAHQEALPKPAEVAREQGEIGVLPDSS